MRLQISVLIASFAPITSLSHAAEEGRMLQIVPPEAVVHKHDQISVVHWGKGIELRRAWGEHIMMSQTKLAKWFIHLA